MKKKRNIERKRELDIALEDPIDDLERTTNKRYSPPADERQESRN